MSAAELVLLQVRWSVQTSGIRLRKPERFAAAATDARRRHWAVRELAGTHLHPVVAPRATADALLEVVDAITRSPPA